MMQGQPAGYSRLFLAGLNNGIFCLGRFVSVSRRQAPAVRSAYHRSKELVG